LGELGFDERPAVNQDDELKRLHAQNIGLRAALAALKASWGTDLAEADEVEVVIVKHDDGWRLWVNASGTNQPCRLRIYRIKRIVWRGYGQCHE
jgi:hypothetical protein